MNTILHLGDIALQYYRGRKTGLVGLASIFFSILIVVAWEYISPIFRVTGISAFLESIGLITPGDAALSGYKILFAIVAVYFLLILITFPALVFFAVLHRLVSSKLGTYGMTAMLGVLLSPLIILNFFLKLCLPNKTTMKMEPRTIVDELMTYKCADGENNAMTLDEAKSYLNRLPTISDNFFLIGVTYEEDLYALFPRPFDVTIYGDIHNKLFCKRLNVHRYNSVNDKVPSYARVPDTFVAKLEVDSRINDIDVEKIELERFKYFIKASDIPDLLNAFSIYMETEQYKSYVTVVQSNFFKGMDKLKYELGDGLDQESFNTLKEELKLYEKVPNQGIIRFVWEGEKLENIEGY